MFRVAAAALLGLALSTQADAAGAFDGTYKGGSNLAGGTGSRCPPNYTFNITVTNSAFRWNAGGTASSTVVSIGPDGAFAAQTGSQFLNGKIENGKLTAQSKGQICNYAWSLAK